MPVNFFFFFFSMVIIIIAVSSINTQLLDVKHNYASLPLFSSDEIDFMIEYLCTN